MQPSDDGPFLRRPISDVIYDAISQKIEAGAFPPGSVLRENMLTQYFGIGRTPVASVINRLIANGLAHRRERMHGAVVGRDRAMPVVPLDRDRLDIHLPDETKSALRVRNWRTLIYAQIEQQIASCLLFGRFRIRSQALAQHFGVSRTIANELLVRLERVGLVRQESNAHWYAGPLTLERIRELYEMRILLEPRALRQAAPRLKRKDIETRLQRLHTASRVWAQSDTGLLHRLEVDLHHDLVLQCTNAELRSTLYRCQLPLITVHLTFGSYAETSDIPAMIVSHEAVLRHLLAGEVEAAAGRLREHLQVSSDSNPHRLSSLRPLDPAVLSPYLDPA